ncbi:SCAR-like protein 2 [Hordeum vulgare]|nr:SCAR-like protein 2 [Hordeum vulgare]
MDWSGNTWHSPDKAPTPHACTGSSSSRRHRFADKDSSGHRPGSVVVQWLAGLPMPLIQCDDCLETMLRLTSNTLQHLGWVFFKCKNDGCHWREEEIDTVLYEQGVASALGFGQKVEEWRREATAKERIYVELSFDEDDD